MAPAQARRDDSVLLVELGEILRISDSSSATMQAVAAALADHLSLSRCFFADLDDHGTIIRVHRGVPRDEMGALPPSARLGLASGRLVVTHGLVAVPLERDKQYIGALVVGSDPPRMWSAPELALVQDVAERTWLWTERERLVGALTELTHELEARVEQRTQDLVRAYDELHVSLREKEVLLKEIHHRVKNNLQVVSSLLSLSRDRIDDPVARSVLVESQDRVRSMALVHEKLYRADDLASVAFGDYVRELATHLWRSSGASERGIDAMIDIAPTLGLAIDLAIPCGLIVNELVTNALKHAFPGNKHGTIRIALAIDEMVVPHRAVLTVGDDGIGLTETVDPRAATSFGLDLVMTFAEQLGADVQVNREAGTEFIFRFATES